MRSGFLRQRYAHTCHRGVAALVVLAVVAVAGCGVDGAPKKHEFRANSQLLSPRAFATAAAAPGTVVVNVHIPYDGQLAGTDLFLPYDRIAARAGVLPSTATRLAIYCRTGRMSAIAARTLRRMGYRRIVELRGGMRAWQRDGLRLQRTARG